VDRSLIISISPTIYPTAKRRTAALIMKSASSLNVYKKVALIRRSTDILTYEDADGNVKTVTDLGEAALMISSVSIYVGIKSSNLLDEQ
jgi:hypothetical protein